MRIGLIPFFGWMPHTAHFIYLTHALKSLGHSVESLTCNGQLPTCYSVEAKGLRRKPITCAKCRFSNGFVNLQTDRQDKFQDLYSPDAAPTPMSWCHSSLRTLHRLEGDSALSELSEMPQAAGLAQASGQVFEAVTKWCSEKKFDFVFLFNGRMDISRAALEAVKQNRIPFASVERSFAGHGMNILPGEDCLGLQAVHRLTQAARDTPLSVEPALAAGKFLFDRLKGQTATEWRNYQKDAYSGSWPLSAPGRRLLILPSSMNEVEGSRDYKMAWETPIEGYEAFIDAADLDPQQIVVRGHPNWAQKIGVADGDKISQVYADWTQERGFHYIPANSNVRTADLMIDADLVLVSHSSAAFEAGSVGRDVVAVGTAHYSKAGFAYDASSPEQLAETIRRVDFRRGLNMEPSRRRRLLRYIYTASMRVPLFANTVVPTDARHCELYKPHSLSRLEAIINGGPLELEPLSGSPSETIEEEVLELLRGHSWPAEYHRDNENEQNSAWPRYRGRRVLEVTGAIRR